MNAEQYIKSKLDGWFFRTDVSGKTIAKSVPHNYKPDHRPAMSFDIVPAHGPHHNAKPWTETEDDTLVEMRGKGDRWEIIAKTLKRALSTLRSRYAELCDKRGIEPVNATPTAPVRLNAAAKAEIIRLRNLGMTFTEINRELGMTGFTARDYYSRWNNQRTKERQAA